MRRIQLLLVMLAGLAVAGCVNQPMGAPQPSASTLEMLRASDLPKMKVGTFVRGPKLPAKVDESMGIRALTLVPPDKSFAKYLGQTLEADLRAAGKFDANSDLVIEGALTENDIDAAIGTGKGELGATFALRKSGATLFEKHLVERSQWDSSFIGAVAIPAAANQYSVLYDRLSAALFADPEFRAAAKTH